MNYHGANGLEFGVGNVKIDPALLKVLPEECEVISTKAHGVSFWARTGRIDVLLSNRASKSFFVKVISKETGRNMVMGEFESMNTAYNVLPGFVPKPVAWGTYASIPDTHFFLCEFREMINDMPDPPQFATSLSILYQKSVSPTGKFGFHVSTYAGNLPQHVSWDDSWESFFTKSMRWALDLEIERKGPNKELEMLTLILFDKVMPRLLRPLESEGRTVKPSLVHGDLWYANSGIDIKNGEPLVFDACCFYAHNECKFGAEYIAAYNSLVQISAPEEDFEGRLDLYRLRFDTHVSALFVENDTLRTQVLDVMRDLIKRYGQAPKAEIIESEQTHGSQAVAGVLVTA
ncbi:Fructosamine kinase-domain-containing protein [Nemania sp. FL0916]|nr:Fructosamine kinase-domain-containing protein [Nemania sp. FL0916]